MVKMESFGFELMTDSDITALIDGVESANTKIIITGR